MSNTLTRSFTKKWIQILVEYESVKSKKSKQFKTVTQLCEFFQIHRSDIRRYYERWIEADRDEKVLLPRRSGAKPGSNKVLSKEDERIIMKIRRRFNSNEHEIQQLVEGHFNVHPSVSTIYRTFKRYPLNQKRKKAIKRYEKEYPGELIHADVCRPDPTLVVDRKKYYLFGAIDDCTRLCYVELMDHQRASNVSAAFARACKWFNVHGFAAEKIMTDNGSEFTAPQSKQAKEQHTFETTLNILGVKHSYTQPYRPQTNGKIERFWRTIQEECFAKQRTTLTKQTLKHEVEAFTYNYNYYRRHGALEYKTPLDKLKKVADLLSKL